MLRTHDSECGFYVTTPSYRIVRHMSISHDSARYYAQSVSQKTIRLGNFRFRSFHTRLPRACNRPITDVEPLYTHSFVNALMRASVERSCYIPAPFISKRFRYRNFVRPFAERFLLGLWACDSVWIRIPPMTCAVWERNCNGRVVMRKLMGDVFLKHLRLLWYIRYAFDKRITSKFVIVPLNTHFCMWPSFELPKEHYLNHEHDSLIWNAHVH